MTRKQLRTGDYPDANRALLGRAVEAARIAAGYPTRKAFAEAAGVGHRSVVYLEQGNRSVGPAVLAPVMRLLGWDEGTARSVLEGDPPPPTQQPEADEVDPDSITDEEVDEALAILYVKWKRELGPDRAAQRVAQERREIDAARKARALKRERPAG